MTIETYDTYEDIKQAVAESGGVLTIYAASLRDAEGAGRLTAGINAKISRNLASHGLGHVPYLPHDLPTNQWGEVRIYDKTTPLGTIITAAHEVGEDSDVSLRGIDGEAARLLDQIRTLLA